MTSWPDAALIEIKRGTFEGKKLDGAIAAKRLYEYVVLNGDCAGEWLNECDTETTVEEWEPLVPVREGLLLNLNKALLDPAEDDDLEQAAGRLLDSVSEELGLIDEDDTVEVPRAVITMLRDNYYRAEKDRDSPAGSLLCAVAVVLGMVKNKAEKTEEDGKA
jgi:hypothetical protein